MSDRHLRTDKEFAMMAPLYAQIRKAQRLGAAGIQISASNLTLEQKHVLECNGFTVTKYKDDNGKESWEYYRISWME